MTSELVILAFVADFDRDPLIVEELIHGQLLWVELGSLLGNLLADCHFKMLIVLRSLLLQLFIYLYLVDLSLWNDPLSL